MSKRPDLNLFPTTRDSSILWWGLIIFIVLTIGVLVPVAPNDYWWYVRVGRDTITTGAVPTVDTLSYTQTGQPVVYHSWLSAVIFWILHRLGGTTLTVLVKGILLAVFYTCIWYTCRLAGAGPRLASAVTLLAALAGSNNWAMRPQIFSYPLFGLTLALLWRGQMDKSKLLWVLPFIMALWVNLHGSFILCFLLVGAALVGGNGNRKRLLIVLGCMALASLLNPRGFGSWAYVLSLLTDPSSQQLGIEWHPPTIEVWQGALFFIWLLLFAPLVAFSSKRLSATRWLWFVGFGWMALSGVRYVIWFLAILAPTSAYLLEPLVGQHLAWATTKGVPTLNKAIALMLLLLPLTLLPGVREHWWPDAPPALAPNTPVEATAWLTAHPELPGPLWSDIAFSSYLTYALPEHPVWIDTRFELFPLEQWKRYIAIVEAAPNWQDLLAEEGIDLLMIDPRAQSRLYKALQHSPEWSNCYQDETAAIFTRSEGRAP